MKNRIVNIILNLCLFVLASSYANGQTCWEKAIRKYAESQGDTLSLPVTEDTTEVVFPLPELSDIQPLEKLTFKNALNRFDRGVINNLFTPKGSWMFGLTVSYLTFDSKESQLLSLLKDFDCTAYTVSVNPFFSYFFRDNISVGMRLSYGRTFGRIDNLEFNLGDDLDLSVNDFFYQQQMYTGTGFVRTYIGLDRGKRFGLFNETSISFGGGVSKFVNGKGDDLTGTYTDIRKLNLGFKPGLAVFIMNNAAVEVSFGVAGLTYRKETQVTDQVEQGSSHTSGANFKINLFNINIGIIVCI